MWSVSWDMRVINRKDLCGGGIRDWVVLITGNGIAISMIRLCCDVSVICNRMQLMPRAGFYPRTIFVLSSEILL